MEAKSLMSENERYVVSTYVEGSMFSLTVLDLESGDYIINGVFPLSEVDKYTRELWGLRSLSLTQ